jgi:hypothetical protein
MEEHVCKNCHYKFVGPYCPQCSQRVIKIPLNYSSLLENILGLIDFNKGFVNTIKILFKSPGTLILDYLNGKTIPYFNPIRFYLTVISLIVLFEL